jgi:tRNA (guanine-N7-)-methyltransferase
MILPTAVDAALKNAGDQPRAFYGRRKGHPLRPQRAGLIETLLPQLALDLGTAAPADLSCLFPVPVTATRLEIGFGGGEHLVAQAETHRDLGFIGCEPFLNGMARALSLIAEKQLANVRLHFGDAADLFAWLPDASLVGVDLLYPDPWPKRRHWKRRFVQNASVTELARVLAPSGVFRFVSDWPDYAAWTLERLLRSPLFTWTAERADDWRLPWPDYTRTRYEEKALRAGRAPCYLVFHRCA